MDNGDLINEAELHVAEAEIKSILNNGFRICCPKCHSEDYGVYPTGQLGLSITRPEEDIHFICRACRTVWNSEFYKDNYGGRKSALNGKIDRDTNCI